MKADRGNVRSQSMELWFQQDGATCHTARATIDLLKDTFGDRLISRFGPVNWPPRSCDLTPLDYFLWGYVKSLVYADEPQTLDHLEDNIRRVIVDIRPQMDYIRASRGSRMPEIIFKISIPLKKHPLELGIRKMDAAFAEFRSKANDFRSDVSIDSIGMRSVSCSDLSPWMRHGSTTTRQK
ncbi:putative DD41D transposase [Trichonephila clavipes]|nr:putative DD41D transposase [Trichonephila clavipes]